VNQPRTDLRLWLMVAIAAAILIIALAMAMLAQRVGPDRSGLLPLWSNVLVVPGVKAGAVPAFSSAVALRWVLPSRREGLAAPAVGARWHSAKYTRNFFGF